MRRIHPSQRGDGQGRIARSICILILSFIPAACTLNPRGGVQTGTPTAAPMPARAAAISFGLIGEVTDSNVWALFAGQEYSYNNYAIRSRYWPRLYALSIPDNRFVPQAAIGAPSALAMEGAFFTGTVPVRTDLRWSDGSPLTANDVVFTVNAALEFELPFDWRDYYDPLLPDHAEASSPDSVKYYFRQQPGVQGWQYGALQGPIVQESYWRIKVAAASEMLPTEDLRANIEALRTRVVTLQQEANDLYAATLTAQPDQARQLQADLKRKQGNLDETTNDLAAAEEEIKEALDAARLALFGKDDGGEPLLGEWIADDETPAVAKPRAFVNVPGELLAPDQARFEQAVFRTFNTRREAEVALEAGDVNVILDPQAPTTDLVEGAMQSPTRSMRFLKFNLDSPALADPALRRALTCMIDQQEFAASVPGLVLARSSFVAAEDTEWQTSDAPLPCAGLDEDARLESAVKTLTAAGYAWDRIPTSGQPGEGLKDRTGSVVDAMELLTPATDEARLAAAAYVEQRSSLLGVRIRTQAVAPDAIDYAVLSSGEFELALLGWRLGSYPSHLCDWYGVGGTFQYDPSTLTSQCAQLALASDLSQARSLVVDIQVTLAAELPMVPLYSPLIVEPIAGIAYPFEAALDGLAGLYGAPTQAMPGER